MPDRRSDMTSRSKPFICCAMHVTVSNPATVKFKLGHKGLKRARALDGRNDDFSSFARGTVIGAQVNSWFLGFDPCQDQPPSAFRAGRPERIDKLESQRVGHGVTTTLSIDAKD